MQIRPFRKDDEDSIADMYNQAFQRQIDTLPEIYQYRVATPEEVYRWRDGGVNTFWIIEVKDRPVGYAQVRIEVEQGEHEIPMLQFMPARSWDLNESNIAVIPEYQREGIASFLVKEIINKYRPDVRIVTAHTFSDNIAGEAFLSHLGFTLYDVFYFQPFSKIKPLENSSIYESFVLEHLQEPSSSRCDINLRRAELKDAETTQELHEHNVFWCEECLTLEWNQAYIEGKYGHTVFVAEYNGKVVGAIDYYKDGRIGIAGVYPEYRGRGLGSAMFYELLREMKKVGLEIAFVDSGLTQTDAIKMYERFNFTIQRRQNCWVKILS